MNNDWLDIGVLEDYLDGKLDAKTMNKVEREALEDPFVAEALAGLSASPKRSLASISLLQKQLKERVAEHHVAKKTKVITWQRLSIAATAAVLFISVSIIFWMKEVARENQLAKQGKEIDISIKPENPVLAGPSAPTAAGSTAVKGSVADAAVAGAALAKNRHNQAKPSAKAKKAVSPESPASAAAVALAGPVLASSSVIAADVVAKDATVEKALEAAKTNSYATNARKRAVTNSVVVIGPTQSPAAAAVMTAEQNAYASPMAKSVRLRGVQVPAITGKVVSRTDGQPLAGAEVRIVQASPGIVAVTDSNGQFKIPADSLMKDYTIAVSHPGFAPNRLVARLNAPVEVLLNKQMMIGSAFIPVGGWQKYNQYLEENNRLTKEHTLGATVQVSFLIGKDGKPYDFKILRTPGEKYDKEAIRLISAGPGWEQPVNPEGRVQVGVKF
ncbi:carboxypeptidase-like regulatory domain-containing protein [Pedobacter sp. PLR]|uniref:carboxypeptidase-like regulatory domain-containing protein n=1 Tax=Pedobacter sp. PLR TaxID=2994465 RepID=UPI00224577A0|nr:carboxypeptidase-like regulatory domain-containing protein [Pedobacter sp. PLR]MCX2450437.1 carboxypeptidase-like regulatory domain-containing protein [Pedobacter sp. PLR]